MIKACAIINQQECIFHIHIIYIYINLKKICVFNAAEIHPIRFRSIIDSVNPDHTLIWEKKISFNYCNEWRYRWVYMVGLVPLLNLKSRLFDPEKYVDVCFWTDCFQLPFPWNTPLKYVCFFLQAKNCLACRKNWFFSNLNSVVNEWIIIGGTVLVTRRKK